MHRLSRLALPIAAALIVGLVITAAAFAHGNGNGHDGKKKPGHAQQGTIVVTEHATTDATTDTGATGDSAGDVLTFANDLFDQADTTKVGPTRATASASSPAPRTSATGPRSSRGGQLVVEGPFYDTKDSTLAITGGTGVYRKARGQMDLHAIDEWREVRFHVPRDALTPARAGGRLRPAPRGLPSRLRCRRTSGRAPKLGGAGAA